MPGCNTVISIKCRNSYGTYILDHLVLPRSPASRLVRWRILEARYIDKYRYICYDTDKKRGGRTMEHTDRQMAYVFKALGDENRIQILKLLRNGEKCACKLLDALNISQPTLSHHMKILCDAGIVSGRKEGKWMHYSICCEGARDISQMLQELLTASAIPDDCCKEN